jgi:hypothetical protein
LVVISEIPDVRGTRRDGELRQQEMRDAAVRQQIADERKNVREDADSRRQPLLSRLLARLRGNDR